MKRFLLTILILIFNSIGSFSQTINEKIERLTISHCGDSLIPQKYELNIKSKKIYFITPFSNHLDIKGEKYKRRVKIDKKKREEIFKCAYQLNLSILSQEEKSDKKSEYYIIEIFLKDNTTYIKIFSDDELPKDFKKLYDAIIDKK